MNDTEINVRFKDLDRQIRFTKNNKKNGKIEISKDQNGLAQSDHSAENYELLRKADSVKVREFEGVYELQSNLFIVTFIGHTRYMLFKIDFKVKYW